MFQTLKYSRTTWLVIGLIAGLVIGGFWPDSPLHAVATALPRGTDRRGGRAPGAPHKY